MNHTLIILGLKKPTEADFADFRPISCSNLTYKLLSKFLEGRMMKVADLLVSPNQIVFMPC